MIIIIFLIGIVIMMTAFSGTYAQLATELETDIPGFFKWGIAIALVVALGYAPGMKTISRWLLALIAVVILVQNGNQIFSAIQSFAQTQPSTGSNAVVQSAATTAAQYANGTTAQPSSTTILQSGNINADAPTPAEVITDSPLPVTSNLLSGYG